MYSRVEASGNDGGCVNDRLSHSGRMKSDIPDWILDDTASVSDQIVLKRDRLETFLERRVRRPRRWMGLFGI